MPDDGLQKVKKLSPAFGAWGAPQSGVNWEARFALVAWGVSTMSLPQIIYGYDEFGEVSLQILVEEVDGQLKITVLEGAANINGIFAEGTGDSLDGFTTNKKGTITDPVNMNGSGEEWDSGFKLSDPGLGQDPMYQGQSTYLTAGGPSLLIDVPADWDLNDITTIGIRATSTTTAAGSIKGVGEEYEPEIDTVTAVDDDPACGVEGLVPITGNVLDNDSDSLDHDLDITHVNGVALADLDATPDGTVYEFAITDGILKIDAETGDFEFTYTGPDLPVGAPDWEGSFTYTVTDGDDSNDSEESVHTATVDLCVDAAAGSQGYWRNHDASGPQDNDWDIAENTSFETYFGVTGRYSGQWDIANPINGSAGLVNDITLRQSLDIPQGGPGENHLASEATTALLNFLDEDINDSFVTAYIYQRGNFVSADTDAADDLTGYTDAEILADLKLQVQDAFAGAADAYSMTELTDLLLATHE
jgi:hypothetical protein